MTKEEKQFQKKTPLSQSVLKDLLCHAPYWVKYMATDRNGEVWGFEMKPIAKKGEWICEDSSANHWPIRFGETEPPTNYKETLLIRPREA